MKPVQLKVGPLKPSVKHNANMGVNRNNTKGDSNIMKPSRQRNKSGMITTAAYKKWAKAATASVSLVADAAEHLERAANVKEVEHSQENPGEKCSDPDDQVLRSLPTFPQNHFIDNNVHSIRTKLKLQLFPIDEPTRRALELDKHNPYLELTLSTRKKISSILEHLNRKWGSSSIAIGELMLFPYILEQSLSVDSLFVFVLIFKYFKVPLMYQNLVLSYGMAGAVFFRLTLILLGTVTLQRFEAVNLFLAAILLYSSTKIKSIGCRLASYGRRE